MPPMTSEKINNFIDAVIKFNLGYFIAKKMPVKGALLAMNEKLPEDPFLNFATKILSHDDKIIKTVEKLFESKGIYPYFYTVPNTRPKNLEKALIKHGYRVVYSDAWMIFDKSKIPKVSQKGFLLRRARKNEFSAVKKVFNEVFTKGQEDDPYKGLSHLYGEFFYRRLKTAKKGYDAEVYAAFVKSKMVGICCLLYDKKDSLIEGLAVLPEFRNIGIGKALLASCIKRSREKSVKNVLILTENCSRNEKIFKKVGFRKNVVSKVYGKPDKS